LRKSTRKPTPPSARIRPTPRRLPRAASPRGGPPRSLPWLRGRLRLRPPRRPSLLRSKIRRNKFLATRVSDKYAKIKRPSFE